MVLVQSIHADESPLTLLRRRRADAEVALRKSLVTSSMLALTFCVLSCWRARSSRRPTGSSSISRLATADQRADHAADPDGRHPPAPPAAPAGRPAGSGRRARRPHGRPRHEQHAHRAGNGQREPRGTIPGRRGAGRDAGGRPAPTDWVDELPDPLTRVKPGTPICPATRASRGPWSCARWLVWTAACGAPRSSIPRSCSTRRPWPRCGNGRSARRAATGKRSWPGSGSR